MSKRIILLIVCISLLGSIFAGCGSKTAESGDSTAVAAATAEPAASEAASTAPEQVKLSGEVTWASHRTDLQADGTFQKFIDEFKQINPDVNVTLETYKDYDNTITVKLASGDVPDVLLPKGQKENYNEFYTDLTDWELTKDFVIGMEPTTVDGKVYGYPNGVVALGVIYNKKIFNELNLAVPQTLDELIANAKAITASGRTGLASAAKATWVTQYYWQDVAPCIANDPNAINKLADLDEPFTADNPFVKAYSILKRFSDEKILEKDPLSADWEPTKTDFRAGKVGMFFLGNWFVPQATGEGSTLTSEDIGFFPFPYDNNKGPHNAIVQPDNSWALSKSSSNPDAAKAFFLFLNDTKYADYCKITGLMSARKSVNVDLPYVEEFNSYNPIKLDYISEGKAFQDITAKMNFSFNNFGQEVIVTNDLNKSFSMLNEKWKKARNSN